MTHYFLGIQSSCDLSTLSSYILRIMVINWIWAESNSTTSTTHYCLPYTAILFPVAYLHAHFSAAETCLCNLHTALEHSRVFAHKIPLASIKRSSTGSQAAGYVLAAYTYCISCVHQAKSISYCCARSQGERSCCETINNLQKQASSKLSNGFNPNAISLEIPLKGAPKNADFQSVRANWVRIKRQLFHDQIIIEKSSKNWSSRWVIVIWNAETALDVAFPSKIKWQIFTCP